MHGPFGIALVLRVYLVLCRIRQQSILSVVQNLPARKIILPPET